MLWYVMLIAAGFAAGVVNTVAGGGSFLTLPALMLFGLDAQLANGTNRVAVLFSSASATLTFDKHGHLDRKLAMRLALPTILGVPVGALLAIKLPLSAFEGLFGALFLAMALLLIRNPKRLTEKAEVQDRSPSMLFAMFFGIGIYVGFIQAGMGILLLLAMSLIKTGDLVASNAVKNLIGFLVTLIATLMFVIFGLVDWVPGLTMAAGNLLGGVVGAKLAIAKGNRLIFGFLVVVMAATGVKLLVSALA
ncbi:MAG: sulfite exporter TauE/SafE family protein [Rubripirellula sp.]|nr:sulfite exporter TauE/SafE family protein [Rubripirellula sp.]